MDINFYKSKNHIDNKSLLSAEKLSQSEIMDILVCAKDLKQKMRYGEQIHDLENKNILLFTKRSLGKSRITLELAAKSLGCSTAKLALGGSDIEELLASPESLEVIGALGIAAAIVDTDQEDDARIISEHMNVPVINANDKGGLCQALALLMTAWEIFGKLKGLKITIVGNANQFLNFIYASIKCGAEVTICAPKDNKVSQDILDYAKQFSDANYTSDLQKAVQNSDVIFCGDYDYSNDYKITEGLIQKTPNVILFQNTPFTRGKQIATEIFEQGKVKYIQAGENMMHIERATLKLVAGKK